MSPVSNVLPTRSVVGDARLQGVSEKGDAFLEGVQETVRTPSNPPVKSVQLPESSDASVLLSEGRPVVVDEQVQGLGTSADGRFSLGAPNGEYTTSSVSSSSQVSSLQVSQSVSVTPLFAAVDQDKIRSLDEIFGNA